MRSRLEAGGEFFAREEAAAAEVIEGGRAGVVDAPGLFAHGDDAGAGVGGGGEVDVAHFGERVADGVVDGAFADLAAFDVGDGNAQGEGDGGGGEHLVAVGDEEEQVGAEGAQRVGEGEDGDADAFGHADVGVGAEEGFDAGGDGESVFFDFADGGAEFGGEVRGHDDEVEIDGRVFGEELERPVEMAVVGAGGGDDGDAARGHRVVAGSDADARRRALGA